MGKERLESEDQVITLDHQDEGALGKQQDLWVATYQKDRMSTGKSNCWTSNLKQSKRVDKLPIPKQWKG